jgi:hypothetical protein
MLFTAQTCQRMEPWKWSTSSAFFISSPAESALELIAQTCQIESWKWREIPGQHSLLVSSLHLMAAGRLRAVNFP